MATTNQKLIKLMSKHGLTLQEVADLLYVSLDAVKSWRVRESTTRHNPMPKAFLELLQIKLYATEPNVQDPFWDSYIEPPLNHV